MIFSIVFEIELRRDIGQYLCTSDLSTLVCNITMDFLSGSGKRLKINAIRFAVSGFNTFSRFVKTLSAPQAFDVLSSFIDFIIRCLYHVCFMMKNRLRYVSKISFLTNIEYFVWEWSSYWREIIITKISHPLE